jgi:hypothetical protein
MRIKLFFLVVSSMAAVYQRVVRHATRAPAGKFWFISGSGRGTGRRAPRPFRMRVQPVYIYPELPGRRDLSLFRRSQWAAMKQLWEDIHA